jgi:hypothetical protein
MNADKSASADKSAETTPCPHCGGTGQVKRTRAVEPWGTWQERSKLAEQAKVGDRWIQIKSGRVAVIEGFTGWGNLLLRHENGRKTSKWKHYFGQEFTPENPPT